MALTNVVTNVVMNMMIRTTHGALLLDDATLGAVQKFKFLSRKGQQLSKHGLTSCDRR